LRSLWDTNRIALRTTCTTHVCTMVSGKTERMASGSPVSPSQQSLSYFLCKPEATLHCLC
jgi:hypothetical protein